MKRNYVLLAVAAALVGGGSYLASPYVAVLSLKAAAANHDKDKLEELVDFPAVRESLKSQMKAAMLKSFRDDPEMRDNPFAGLALAMAPAMIDGMIDSFVTPDAMTVILRDGKPGKLSENTSAETASAEAAPAEATPADTASAETAPPGPEPDYDQGYTDLNSFKVTIHPHNAAVSEKTALVFKRQGLFDWRLKRIDLPLNDLPKT